MSFKYNGYPYNLNVVLDTHRIDSLATLYSLKSTFWDTITITKHDTITITKHDTVTITKINYDTIKSYVSVQDTLVIALKSGSGITTKNISIKVYPNPATDYLIIEDNEVFIESIKFFNLNGVLLKTISRQGNLTYIPINNLARGTYSFILYCADGSSISRIVILK